MKRYSAIAFILCGVLLIGCNHKKQDEPKVTTIENNSLQIGLSFDSFVIERWQRDRDVFVSTAEELGAEVNVQVANGDIQEQIDQIEYFIEKKMDVIVIISVDSEKITNVVKKAQEAGIKIIAYDRLIKNANVDLYISFDNEEVGRLMAESLIHNVPEYGKISVAFGPTEDNNVLLVEKGFRKLIATTNLEIVHTEYAEGWLAEKAFQVVNETLKKVSSIDGMVCGNDNLAGQAIRALSEQRLAGDVCVIGQDADLDACQRIVEGTQTMTVYKSVDTLANKAAEYAIKLAKGEEITTSDTFYDGTNTIPYEKLIPIAVTKQNIDKVIILGGFHLREEVYLNIPN